MKPEGHLKMLMLGEIAACVTAATIVVFRFHDPTLHLTLGLLVGLLAGMCSGVILGWCWRSICDGIARDRRAARRKIGQP
jgi:F0F1-type ATP synthase membrane subunit c/vacuolar-type H+-ATPase subunit K